MKTLLLFTIAILFSGSFYAQYIVPAGTTETFTLGTSFPDGVIIEPSGVLIVDGATFSMAPGTKIIVKNRGKLIGINGARFESFPGESWYGIELVSASLASPNANLAVDFNEVTVTGAQYGISLAAPADRERSISCKNTVFIDNVVHLYLNANVGNVTATGFSSEFTNCEFLSATGTFALHLGRSRFHTYSNCVFDCSFTTDQAIHCDAMFDSKFKDNTFKPHRTIGVFLHFLSERIEFTGNTFEMQSTGNVAPGGFEYIAIALGEGFFVPYKEITIFDNSFIALDAPELNNACGIYSEAEKLANVLIRENRFEDVHTAIDINNNFGSKAGTLITLNTILNYVHGIKLRDNNTKLRMICNTFETAQDSPIAIWNETGTVQDHTVVGPMNEFLSGGVHLQNTGAFWEYSTASVNTNTPVAIVGPILMNSVLLFESCGIGKKTSNNTSLLESRAEVSVFPNPSQGNFSIDLSSLPSEAVQVTVADITGRIIYTKSVEPDAIRLLHIDFTNEATGLYFVNMVSTSINLSKQIIIK